VSLVDFFGLEVLDLTSSDSADHDGCADHMPYQSDATDPSAVQNDL
jgi:hypothetical protein